MILITGATGSNGSELTKLLASRSVPVRAMVRSKDRAKAIAALDAAPSNRDPRPSSLALCRIEGLPDFYSGATGLPGRFSEGLLLRRLDGLLLRLGSAVTTGFQDARAPTVISSAPTIQ